MRRSALTQPAPSQVVLLALPGLDLGAVEAELATQLGALPRGDTARKALSHSSVVRVPDAATAARLSNLYAPEHLIVNVEGAEAWLPELDNAGSVFLGRWCAPSTEHVMRSCIASMDARMTCVPSAKSSVRLLGKQRGQPDSNAFQTG